MLDSNYDITSNTKAYYKLNETSGTSVADSSGNGNNGTASNVTWVAGKVGSGAASFNGSSSRVQVARSASLEPSVITISAWINVAGGNGTQRAIVNYNRNNLSYNVAYLFGLSTANKLILVQQNGSSTGVNDEGTATIAAGSGRKHVVCVRDPAAGTINFYIDGVLDRAITGNTYALSYTGVGVGLTIGAYTPDGSTYVQCLNGLIDEVIIEDTAWTATQVLDYYKESQTRYLGEYLGAGPTVTKGLYHLNGDAKDSSGNGNNGIATNVSRVGGKVGSGAASMTSTGYINMGNVLNFEYNQAVTRSFWIKTTENSSNKHILSKQLQTSPNRGARIELSSGKIACVYYSGTLGSISRQTSTTVNDGTWKNIVVTYDGSGSGSGVLIYVNGAPVSVENGPYSGWTQSISATVLTTDSFQINGRWNTNNSTLAMDIDEVIIENRIWTATEVKKYYTYAKGRFGIT